MFNISKEKVYFFILKIPPVSDFFFFLSKFLGSAASLFNKCLTQIWGFHFSLSVCMWCPWLINYFYWFCKDFIKSIWRGDGTLGYVRREACTRSSLWNPWCMMWHSALGLTFQFVLLFFFFWLLPTDSVFNNDISILRLFLFDVNMISMADK